MDLSSELERRVTHVENETVHIYDLIEERSAEVRAQFAEVRAQFAEVREQFAEVREQFAEVRGKFAEIDHRFTAVDQRFDEINRVLGIHGDLLAEILRRLPEPA